MITRQERSSDGTGTLSCLLIDEQSHHPVIIDPNGADDDAITAEVGRDGGALGVGASTIRVIPRNSSGPDSSATRGAFTVSETVA